MTSLINTRILIVFFHLISKVDIANSMRIGPSYAVFLLYLENLLFLQMVCRGKGQTDDDEIAEKAKKLAEMMQHDGVKRVMTMTSKNFNTLLKKYPIVVALFHAQPNTSSLTQDKEVLEVRTINVFISFEFVFDPVALVLFNLAPSSKGSKSLIG